MHQPTAGARINTVATNSWGGPYPCPATPRTGRPAAIGSPNGGNIAVFFERVSNGALEQDFYQVATNSWTGPTGIGSIAVPAQPAAVGDANGGSRAVFFTDGPVWSCTHFGVRDVLPNPACGRCATRRSRPERTRAMSAFPTTRRASPPRLSSESPNPDAHHGFTVLYLAWPAPTTPAPHPVQQAQFSRKYGFLRAGEETDESSISSALRMSRLLSNRGAFRRSVGRSGASSIRAGAELQRGGQVGIMQMRFDVSMMRMRCAVASEERFDCERGNSA